MNTDEPFVFPRWTNRIRAVLAVAAAGAALYAVVIVTFGFSPQATDVGYEPDQPVPYSHAVHVGKLGIDCRYCHVAVEDTPRATIPSTEICMNCHSGKGVAIEQQRLWRIAPIRESAATGKPIPWVRVHDLPDYVYFDHSAHVRRGVGCVTCHGRVDQMEKVRQVQPLSMQWCLGCHRDPDPYLRPLDRITDMEWTAPGSPRELGRRLREQYGINPSTDCSTCHR